MTETVKVALAGREHVVARARLGPYLRLQAAQERIDHGVEAQDTGAIADGLYEYLSTAMPDLPRDDFETATWLEVMTAFRAIDALNHIPEKTKYSILRRIEDRRGRSVPWQYVGRSATYWIHIIASAYHWPLSEIENLWPEQAVAFIQEIMVDDQLDREFEHSLSQVAYTYDKSAKKSRYVPLTRPVFMVEGTGKFKKVKLHRKLLPQGSVIYPDGVDEDLKVTP